jgi:gamma-glutamyltranspeptidase/glutathione hydrolase
VALSQKFGQLEFKTLFQPAINYAKNGFLVSPIVGEVWGLVSRRLRKKFPEFVETFLPGGKAPNPAELFKNPYQAKTLEEIANSDGESFYSGELAKKIVAHSKNTGGSIELEDLEKHEATWETLLDLEYKGYLLHEIPPNGQGLTAQIMLGILKNFDIEKYGPDSTESIHLQIEAMKLAFADAYRYLSDIKSLEFEPSTLINPEYLKKRANHIDMNSSQFYENGFPDAGDTVYLASADSEGMMVSYIQSNYEGFGSGIVIPKTGISLQNRGNGFTLQEGHPNQVGPNKRPYHTIIPAFMTKNKKPIMSFGVMGGSMQPQGHTQLIIRIFNYAQNPQAAIDAPRWRWIQGYNVQLERGFSKATFQGLQKIGHNVSYNNYLNFGGAQAIYKLDEGYLAASDPRKDGQAIGY